MNNTFQAKRFFCLEETIHLSFIGYIYLSFFVQKIYNVYWQAIFFSLFGCRTIVLYRHSLGKHVGIYNLFIVVDCNYFMCAVR